MTRQSPPIVPERGVPLTAETVVVPVEPMRLVPDRVLTEALYWMARGYERVHSMPRVSDTELANKIEAAKADLGRARDASPVMPALSAAPAREPEGGAVDVELEVDRFRDVIFGYFDREIGNDYGEASAATRDLVDLIEPLITQASAALTPKEAPAATIYGKGDVPLSVGDRVRVHTGEEGVIHQFLPKGGKCVNVLFRPGYGGSYFGFECEKIEAPAATGAGLSPEDHKAIGKALYARREGNRSTEVAVRKLAEAGFFLVRAQPQAREEAQPVEYVLVSDMEEHSHPGYGEGYFCTTDAVRSFTPPSQPLAEGADAEKLRVAVEALERVKGWINRRVEIGTTGATAQVTEISKALATLYATPTAVAPEEEDKLRAICQRMADDFQSSETHHPNHYLVNRLDFEAMTQALAALQQEVRA